MDDKKLCPDCGCQPGERAEQTYPDGAVAICLCRCHYPDLPPTKRERREQQSDPPSAYSVQQCRDGRWYPMRFGRFRRDSRGYRVSYGRREDAEAFCHNEQADYVRAYPSVADGGRG